KRTSIPSRALWRASSATSAGSTSILDGMQPRLRHVPPNTGSRSTIAIFQPARSSGIALPDPLPMTIRSYCSATPGSQPSLGSPTTPGPVACGVVTRSYIVRTYGCQMNEHDSERISGLLEADGLVRADSEDDADV